MASPVTATSVPESKWAFSHVEQAVKSLAAFTILLYALGLLTANQYLMSIGISDFSSLKPKFVLTGIWVFAFYIFSSSPVIVPLLYSFFSKKPLQGNHLRYAAFSVFGFAVGFVLDAGLLTVLIRGNTLSSLMWNSYILNIIPVASGPLLIAVLLPSEKRSRAARLFVGGMLALVGLAVFSDLTVALYDVIPDAYGGGLPVVAMLYFNKDGARLWHNLQATTCSCSTPESTISSPIYILYQNEQQLIVKTKFGVADASGQYREQVVAVNKNLLDGYSLKYLVPAESVKH